MEKLLEVDNLTKQYFQGGLIARTALTAADNVSFFIKPAEIFTLAGESGCGKTTTAKVVLGFEEATSGEISHNGKVQTGKEKVWITEGVQAIFQDPFSTFNPLRTVDSYFYETVHNFKLGPSKRKEAIEYIDKKLRLVGLTYHEFAGKYPNEFSGGQLQRISIARALVTDPKLMIADEPVSMVDASLRMSIVNLFKQLRDEFGVSVLYITHDLATAYYVSDRIAIMFRPDRRNGHRGAGVDEAQTSVLAASPRVHPEGGSETTLDDNRHVIGAGTGRVSAPRVPVCRSVPRCHGRL